MSEVKEQKIQTPQALVTPEAQAFVSASIFVTT
jgi:hypothetical protein